MFHLGYALAISGRSAQEKAEGIHLVRMASAFSILWALPVEERNTAFRLLRENGFAHEKRRRLMAILARLIAVVVLAGVAWSNHIEWGDEFHLWFLTRFRPQPSGCWASRLVNAHVAQAVVDHATGRYYESLKRWQMVRDDFMGSPEGEWGVDLLMAKMFLELGDTRQAELIIGSVESEARRMAEKEDPDAFNLLRADSQLRKPSTRPQDVAPLLRGIPEPEPIALEPRPRDSDGRQSLSRRLNNAADYWRVRSTYHRRAREWKEMVVAERQYYILSAQAGHALRPFDWYTDVQTLLSYTSMKGNYRLARDFVLAMDCAKREMRLGGSAYRRATALQNSGADRRDWSVWLDVAEGHFERFAEEVQTLSRPAYEKLFDAAVEVDVWNWQVQDWRSRIAELRDQREEACDLGLAAVDVLERLRARIREKNLRAHFAVGRDSVYLRAASLALRSGQNERAFEVLEASRARRMLDDFQLRGEQTNDANRDGSEADVAEVHTMPPNVQKVERQIRELVLTGNVMVSQFEDLVAKRRRLLLTNRGRASFWGTGRSDGVFTFPSQIASVEAVMASLRKGEVLLEFFVPPEGRPYVFAIDNQELRVLQIPMNRSDLISASRVFAQECGDPSRRFSVAWEDYARELGEALLPVQAVNWSDPPIRLYVVPHRELHEIPFEALFLTNGSPLIEMCEVCYLPSASLLVQLGARASSSTQTAPGVRSPVAILDPTSTLPGARTECEYLARNYDARIIEDGTIGDILQVIREGTVVHLGVHGYADALPSLSFLLVAQDKSGGGLLSLGQLLDSQCLLDAELVFAAACESGMVRSYDAGDERYSFGTGFLLAGAQSSVSARWRVPDDSTASFVKAFYSFGAPWSSAHRQAMIECRRKYPHPYFWAGMMLSGIGRQGGEE
ncbi:MAG: CHAT domain-containing protein [Pseudomonadota bacterium]